MAKKQWLLRLKAADWVGRSTLHAALTSDPGRAPTSPMVGIDREDACAELSCFSP
jgi:hypothetical protein